MRDLLGKGGRGEEKEGGRERSGGEWKRENFGGIGEGKEEKEEGGKFSVLCPDGFCQHFCIIPNIFAH